MRRGFTITELLVTLAVMAVVAGLVVPRLQLPLDRLAVERAAYEMSAAHMRARMSAVARNRVVLLGYGPDSLRIRVLSDGDTATFWSRPGPVHSGVVLTGPTRWLRFHPAGVTYGFSNGTWVVARGRSQRTVVVSRLGRLRVLP